MTGVWACVCVCVVCVGVPSVYMTSTSIHSFVWCKRKLFGLNVPKLDSSRAKEVIKEQYNKLGRIK